MYIETQGLYEILLAYLCGLVIGRGCLTHLFYLVIPLIAAHVQMCQKRTVPLQGHYLESGKLSGGGGNQEGIQTTTNQHWQHLQTITNQQWQHLFFKQVTTPQETQGDGGCSGQPEGPADRWEVVRAAVGGNYPAGPADADDADDAATATATDQEGCSDQPMPHMADHLPCKPKWAPPHHTGGCGWGKDAQLRPLWCAQGVTMVWGQISALN